MKRIVLTDESLNSYGFWVLTSGMDLSAFLRNPVMLWNHNRSEGGTVNDQLPIGYWKDLRVEADGSITAEPVFDETDEFAVKIKKKYESGVLNACSIGFRILEWSEDPKFLKPGQTVATATKSVLLEASICDIPSNPNATKVVLYNENSETAGGTLEVASSGTVTLTGDLSLADGTALAFNFTDQSTPPQLALSSGNTLTASGAVTVKVSATGIDRPKAGEHVLTTCGGFDAAGVTVALAADAPKWVRGLSVNGDGNIVMDVKPKGTMIIVR